MSFSEHGSAYSFLSSKEKADYHKKPYYLALICFLLFSVCHLASTCFLIFSDVITYWLIMFFTPIFCIFSSICWYITVRNYNKAIHACFWENLDANLWLRPNSIPTIGSVIFLPLINIITMIPITLKTALHHSELNFLSFGSTVIFLICVLINTLSTLQISKTNGH